MMILTLIGNEAKADRCSNFNKCPLHQYLIFCVSVRLHLLTLVLLCRFLLF